MMVRAILLFCCLLLIPYSGGLHAAESKASKKKESRAARATPAGKKKKKKQSVQKAKPAASIQKGEGGVASEGVTIVKELRYWSNPDYTRIAVNLDRDARFEYHHLPSNREAGVPPRLYIDVTGAKIGPGVKDIPIGDGLLKQARVAQYRPDVVRVVLDLDSIRECKVFSFSDPSRIIVDVKGERREELVNPPAKSLVSLPAPRPEATEEKQKAQPRKAIGNIRRIVVDPGHGGHDPGAVGLSGTHEKDVVLEIALKLAKKLREELGLDVVMTRTTDIFLELQERTAIANQVGADLFVSVHANASLNRSASGIETYYLNLAKTEKAAQLAAKENGTSLEKVSLLQAVLFDLMANYKINDSARLADEVQKSLHGRVSQKYPSVKNLGVKQGPFYVLVGATMPSILVETAFLSNEREEERLSDGVYQEETAAGIVEGIRAYVDSLN